MVAACRACSSALLESRSSLLIRVLLSILVVMIWTKCHWDWGTREVSRKVASATESSIQSGQISCLGYFLVSTLTGEEICPHRGKDCLGCASCTTMFCSVCMERNTRPVQGSNIAYNPFVTGGSTIFRKAKIQERTNSYHKSDKSGDE
jgi:hypothetical protein